MREEKVEMFSEREIAVKEKEASRGMIKCLMEFSELFESQIRDF